MRERNVRRDADETDAFDAPAPGKRPRTTAIQRRPSSASLGAAASGTSRSGVASAPAEASQPATDPFWFATGGGAALSHPERHGGASPGAVQRKLTVTGGAAPKTFVGDGGEDELRAFVAAATRKPLGDQEWKAAWTVGGLRKYLAAVRGGDLTVDHDALMQEAERSAQLALAIGGKGLPLFDRSPEVTFGEEDGAAARGYTVKNISGLEKYLLEASAAVVTVGRVEDAVPEQRERDGLELLDSPATGDAGDQRQGRPGLNALNVGTVYWDPAQKRLVVCNLPGVALAEHFAMALIAHASHIGHALQVHRVDASSETVEKGYGRLTDFFAVDDEFRRAQTLVFGYKAAFEGDERYRPIEERTTGGWAGTLFRVGEDGPQARHLAVLGTDRPYHGEILAKNIEGLLASPGGAGIRTVLTGGSAGALVPSEPPEDGSPHLPPSSIFTPERIMGPDGALVPNVLAPHGQTRIPDSIHTSVVSAFVETPELLESLHRREVRTIDMEFGYVAAVIGGANRSREPGQRVQFGIACLVTDYPRTSSQTRLSEKKTSDKAAAKQRFVDTIHSFATAE